MLLIILICAVFLPVDSNDTQVYDSYTGEIISEELLAHFVEANLTSMCINSIEPCGDGDEFRRIDGSCNNLKYPSRGAFHTPQFRLLPADFGDDYNPRLTSTGEEMKLGRYVKNRLLDMGYVSDNVFTQAVAYYLEFIFGDLGSIHDVVKYVFQTNCCKSDGEKDQSCIPHRIPSDDPVHRYSGHTCLNFTIPMTFQNLGCVDNTTVPDRIDYTTTHYDLSSIYEFLDGVNTKIRTYSGGLLKTETVNGHEFTSDGSSECTILDAIETGCIRDVPNTLIGTNLFSTYFWRQHNYFARELAEINPCWDDELLFQHARDINIACYQHMTLYEVFQPLLGAENMCNLNITHNSTGHRDIYDDSIVPQLSLEYNYMFRWFHVIQNADQKTYDENGYYLKEMPIVNFSSRNFDLAIDNVFEEITNGMHRQECGGFDPMVHPDITNRGVGAFQNVLDIPTSDLVKARWMGLPSYAAYCDYCSGYTKTHTTFDDFADYISPEGLARLKDIYPTASDVELMAATWWEGYREGTHVPHMVYCILTEQLQRTVKSDRYLYDNPNRPYAYSNAQLQEIRKASLASMLCVTTDVNYIQPQAFLIPGDGNEMVSCDEIPKIDLTQWADASCAASTDE